jgi:hypothetical protein
MSQANAQSQPQTPLRSLQDSHHNVIGYFRDGSIIDKDNNFLGLFTNENNAFKFVDRNHKTIGYSVGNEEIQDANRKTAGYVEISRANNVTTVKNAQKAVVGYIKEDGTVEDANHNVIGYEVKIEPVWAAVYYFLLKF